MERITFPIEQVRERLNIVLVAGLVLINFTFLLGSIPGQPSSAFVFNVYLCMLAAGCALLFIWFLASIMLFYYQRKQRGRNPTSVEG